ncbi:hypothetical protein EUGRSUZ_B01794 [Eucalyptus grandis]|uniref:Uncharacterized protein n=2 Tax=Eucalyptus grandis TaxID=71139 RepID=A0ACC3LR29_EUCGR|nr:hypothetical protein EUGRSUZ_B01794 [Eucalyptus grandis]
MSGPVSVCVCLAHVSEHGAFCRLEKSTDFERVSLEQSASNLNHPFVSVRILLCLASSKKMEGIHLVICPISLNLEKFLSLHDLCYIPLDSLMKVMKFLSIIMLQFDQQFPP